MSVKQIILGLVGLGTITACLTWWTFGAISGFHLFEKLPDRVKKYWRVYTAITMLSGGGVAGVAAMRGCGSLGGAAAATTITGSPYQRRQAIKLVSPLDVLGGLRLARAKEEREEKLKLEKEERELRRKADAEARKIMRELKRQAQAQGFIFLSNGNVAVTNTSGTVTVLNMAQPQGFQKVGSRKGPFCRVTCEFHHGSMDEGKADVEVDGQFCKSGIIPLDVAGVPGWALESGGEYEYQNDWPGPANPQGGLDSYKLYWAGKPK